MYFCVVFPPTVGFFLLFFCIHLADDFVLQINIIIIIYHTSYYICFHLPKVESVCHLQVSESETLHL